MKSQDSSSDTQINQQQKSGLQLTMHQTIGLMAY